MTALTGGSAKKISSYEILIRGGWGPLSFSVLVFRLHIFGTCVPTFFIL
ncbi:MAG: hypothetical protein ThorAB25_21580 [Candidatus Thorarchaeota archaeon AB_25]|nr:MAG: hypothetical protein ThorAB25_21580 [Candidatus Thorarchaeota archaeon AB_25]